MLELLLNSMPTPYIMPPHKQQAVAAVDGLSQTQPPIASDASAFLAAGSGLMDIGVGAFIFTSGISSRPASQSVKLYKGLVRSLRRNSILLILGQHCSLPPG